MAHFYGTLKGSRGEATRLGHKGSGIVTHTASWEGAVRVHAYYDAALDKDMVRVSLIPWHGVGTSRTLYEGPISGEPHPIPDLNPKPRTDVKATHPLDAFLRTIKSTPDGVGR